MLQGLGAALMVILYLAAITSPGAAATALGWLLSRSMKPVVLQTFFRTGLFATAVTPTIYGHAGLVPAIVLVFVLKGQERLAGIVPILIVWLIAFVVISTRAKKKGRRLRYLDEVFAWLIFCAGLVQIVLTDFLHMPGIVDTALVWILAAMLNLLRIKSDRPIRLLRIFCVAANLSVLILEAVRLKMFEHPSSLVLLVLILLESFFSISTRSPGTNQPGREHR